MLLLRGSIDIAFSRKTTVFLMIIVAAAVFTGNVYPGDLISRFSGEAVEQSGLPLLLIDPDTGFIIDANRAAEDFYHYPLWMLKGMPVDVISILPFKEIHEDIASAASGIKKYFIFKHRIATGDIKDVEIHAWPVEAEGRVYLFSLIHDITERKESDRKLAESESMLKKGERFARFGYLVLYLSSGSVKGSEGAQEILGIKDDEWSFSALESVIHPDDREIAGEYLKNLIVDKADNDISYRVRNAIDSRVIHIHLNAFHNHEESTVFVILKDITEEVLSEADRAEQAAVFYKTIVMVLIIQLAAIILLIRSRRNRIRAQKKLIKKTIEFDSFFSLSQDILGIVDTYGNFLTINKAFGRLLGYSMHEFTESRFYDFIYQEDMEEAEKFMACFTEETRVSKILTRCVCKSGKYCSIEWQGVIHENKIYITGRDVTERIEHETERSNNENLLSGIFEILPVGIWIIDTEGKPVRGNPMGLKIWDMDQSLPLSDYSSFKVRQYLPGDEIKEDENNHSDLFLSAAGKKSFSVRDEILEIVSFKGEKKYIISNTAPVVDKAGKITGIIAINQDITHLKKAEDERILFERQIQQTQKLESLGVLAGGIAHDFNNILMAVLGHAELALMDIPKTSPARKSIKEIEKAAKRAAELSAQMLAYTGHASFVKEEVNLPGLVEEMTSLIKTLIGKKIIFNMSIMDNLPSIFADPGQISQVLMNLIINSSEAIGDKSGVITVSTGVTICDVDYLKKTELYEELSPGLYVHVEVADTGCGMTNGEREKIFDPFYTTKFTGRGLGLAAVLGIIKGHRGAIKVYSESGRGTTFKILFPALEIKSGIKRSISGSEQEDSDAWKGEGTVLFADDEESLRSLAGKMLERLGYSVIMAEDGREAVNIYRERMEEIDLVILDLTMPNMDGSQAFTELRKINSNVKVIIASGYNHEDVEARFAGKSYVGIIQKPYSVEKLKKFLKELKHNFSRNLTYQ